MCDFSLILRLFIYFQAAHSPAFVIRQRFRVSGRSAVEPCRAKPYADHFLPKNLKLIYEPKICNPPRRREGQLVRLAFVKLTPRRLSHSSALMVLLSYVLFTQLNDIILICGGYGVRRLGHCSVFFGKAN